MEVSLVAHLYFIILVVIRRMIISLKSNESLISINYPIYIAFCLIPLLVCHMYPSTQSLQCISYFIAKLLAFCVALIIYKVIVQLLHSETFKKLDKLIVQKGKVK